jgi:hypothetical protein
MAPSGASAPPRSAVTIGYDIARGTPAGLASGRSPHNRAQAKFPPVSPIEVLYSAGDPTEGVSPCPVFAYGGVVAADHLASGRSPHNDAEAKFPPISPPTDEGRVFYSAGDPTEGMSPCSGSSRAAALWRLTIWRQADHYATSQRRSSRLFPGRVFYSAGDPTEGRLCNNVRSGTHTLLGSPDLCKSGAEILKITGISDTSPQHTTQHGLNGVSVYSKHTAALTKI